MKQIYETRSGRGCRRFGCVCAAAAVSTAVLFSGCGKPGEQKTQKQTQAEDETEPTKGAKKQAPVKLTVWGAEEDQELIGQLMESFQNEYKDEAKFQFTYGVQSESNCKNALFGDLEQAADVFAFADDQLHALAAAGAIDPIENADTIRTEHLATAVEAASVGDTMYAYPLTADNGYFMYYNQEYFTKEDVESLERMLEVAAEHGKYVAMDWSSAWYVYAFFGNTGMEVGLNEDGITNYCTWNQKKGAIKGVDVAQSMLDIAKSPRFSNRTDAEFLQGVQDGSVIAGVSGVWNAVAIQDLWKEQMGAAKLPSFACARQQVQMASFSGCKLIGVNAYSKEKAWAAKLAEWITNEQNQNLRFKLRGQGPSNKQAAASSQVQGSPAIAALLAQAEYSQLQRVGGKFWEPVETFAKNMAQQNASGEDLQKQLDRMAEQVTAR